MAENDDMDEITKLLGEDMPLLSQAIADVREKAKASIRKARSQADSVGASWPIDSAIKSVNMKIPFAIRSRAFPPAP